MFVKHYATGGYKVRKKTFLPVGSRSKSRSQSHRPCCYLKGHYGSKVIAKVIKLTTDGQTDRQTDKPTDRTIIRSGDIHFIYALYPKRPKHFLPPPFWAVNEDSLEMMYCSSKETLALHYPPFQITLLDPKKSMNVNIFLKQFRKPIDVIIELVKSGDPRAFGVEKLKALAKILPQTDEVAVLLYILLSV